MVVSMASIVLIVGSNIVYNVAQKSTPEQANPFLALLVTYLTAALLSGMALFFYRSDGPPLRTLGALNWTSVVLGISIVGLELGYLLAYRAGWDISAASLVANIALALALIPVGVLFYREGFGLNKLLGAALCIGGLILIYLR